MFLLNPKLFYSPEDNISSSLSKDDIFNELGKDDEPLVLPKDDDTEDEDNEPEIKDKKTKDDKKETKSDDEKNLDELEEDIEGDEDIDDTKDELESELLAPVRRKEILKEFPELFKKFPYIEHSLYKMQQYNEVFPTLSDAKEAVKKANTLDKYENDLINGSIEKTLAAAKQNPAGFNKIIDNYLTTLQKVDEKAFTHVVGNVISHTIYNMVTEARKSNNDALRNAAAILNQYIFSTSDYVPPKTLSTEERVNPEAERLNKEKQQFLQDRFNTVNGDLSSRVSNTIKSAIEDNIDPKSTMTDYVRKNAAREAMENVNEMLTTNRRFRAIVDKLWENAAKNNYNIESVNKIRSAFLSQARTLLPTAIKKARNEALKGMGKRVARDDNDDMPADKADRAERKSRDTGSPNNKSQDRNQPKPGESTLDFLMRD